MYFYDGRVNNFTAQRPMPLRNLAPIVWDSLKPFSMTIDRWIVKLSAFAFAFSMILISAVSDILNAVNW